MTRRRAREIPVLALGLLSSSTFGYIGWIGAAAVATNPGPDYTGIALLITAITGLIATLFGLILGLRRKPPSPIDTDLVLRLAVKALEKEDHDPPS